MGSKVMVGTKLCKCGRNRSHVEIASALLWLRTHTHKAIWDTRKITAFLPHKFYAKLAYDWENGHSMSLQKSDKKTSTEKIPARNNRITTNKKIETFKFKYLLLMFFFPSLLSLCSLGLVYPHRQWKASPLYW
jgi:hypothetical protein